MTDPRRPDDEPPSGAAEPRDDRPAEADPAGGDRTGDALASASDGEHLPPDGAAEAQDDPDEPDRRGEEKARKLSREEAREAAEAERVAREEQALEDALELARADAERMLAGPGLVTPDPPIPPSELEAHWSGPTLAAREEVRADLQGRRLGLAISGGGALGSFEAGVLRFLYDHLDIDPVAICGNSAGAMNAAKLAEGDHPDRRPIDEVERIWRSLRINSDMWEPEPWLVRLQASASWAAELREQVSDAEGATSAVKVAVRVVGSLVRRPPETDGTLDAVKDAIRAQSLLSLAPVAELVERELEPERIRESGIALRVGTVSLEAGELRYVTEDGELHDRHDEPIGQPPVPLADGVLASASIPMAFPPVEMNGEHYVDGGAREILPLELLVSRMGAERVIAISASSASIKRAKSFADRNLIDILRRVSAEIGPNETLRKELNPPGGWDPHVRLVVPQFDVHDSMTIDPALIAISVDHGYLRAADVLLSLGPEAAELTEQITRLRTRLRHLAGPVPTIFDTTLGRQRRERLEQEADPDPDADVIEVEVVPSGEDVDEHDGGAEGMVRSARSRTATTVARLVKVIGRDGGDRDDPDADDDEVAPGDEPEPGTNTDADVDADAGSRPESSGDRPRTVRVEVGVDDDGADIEVHQGGDSVEVVIAPRDRDTSGRSEDLREAEHHGRATGDGDEGDAATDRERDSEGSDPEAAQEEADRQAARQRREDVAAVTAELRLAVQQRHDQGLPLPQTLLAWLLGGSDADGDGTVSDTPVDEVDRPQPVGGSALGGA